MIGISASYHLHQEERKIIKVTCAESRIFEVGHVKFPAFSIQRGGERPTQLIHSKNHHPSLCIDPSLHSQDMRGEKADFEEALRRCQSSLAESEQKLSNWRKEAEKRADDEDEMEKLVVNLNKKVNDLEVCLSI